MMDKEKILKWCGFEIVTEGELAGRFWIAPDDYAICPTDEFFDMNFYFKYAVPKLDSMELEYDYRLSTEEGSGGNYKVTHSDHVYIATLVLDVYGDYTATGEDKDPAEAFGNALMDLVDEDTKG